MTRQRARETVERALARIAALEPHVRAWRVVDAEGARRAAAALEAAATPGILHGVPIGVKDVIDVAGLPTRAGSRWLAGAPPAAADAPVVARLRAAGAIVLGKTHTAEYAFFEPAPTRNPHAPGHTPGGSSSGSAAAVAVGMVPLALGTQTNASLCRPAAYCGVAAFKPTTGSLPVDGVVPLAATFDTVGFIGRRATDLVSGWQAAAGASLPGSPSAAARRLRVGVAADPLLEAAEPPVRACLDRALEALRAAGHAVVEARAAVPLVELATVHRTIAAREAALHHARAVGAAGTAIGGRFREWVAEGEGIGAARYERALRLAAQARAVVWGAWAGLDLVVAPPAPSPAPEGLASTGDPTFVTPWTLLGGPLAVLPAGADGGGLPLSVMLAARPGADAALLDWAVHVESLLPGAPAPRL